MTSRHLIPSVAVAEAAYQFWAERARYDRHQGCHLCDLIWRQQEAASVALDNALSVGRSFDRARQQAIWQQREDAALRASVAW